MKFSYIDVGQKYNYDVFKWLYSYSNIEGQEILTLVFYYQDCSKKVLIPTNGRFVATTGKGGR